VVMSWPMARLIPPSGASPTKSGDY
jgi:hypothetical protein